jgi:hypothetical protein
MGVVATTEAARQAKTTSWENMITRGALLKEGLSGDTPKSCLSLKGG